jgi:protein ImuB
MLWLAAHLPLLPLDVFARAWPPELQARPFAIDSGGHVPRIVACNDAARELGVRDGMLLSAAYALAPDLVQQSRDPVAEQGALEQLATFALAFTPMVSLVPPGAFVAEIGGSLKLFGGRAKIAQRLRNGLAARGFDARLGIAPTPIAALALARAGSPAMPEDAKELAGALDALPLDVFDVDADVRATLAAAGVRSFGAADRLPRDGLARRFGPDLVAMLDRARAREPDPRLAYEPPPRFASRLELPASVDDSSTGIRCRTKGRSTISPSRAIRSSGIYSSQTDRTRHYSRSTGPRSRCSRPWAGRAGTTRASSSTCTGWRRSPIRKAIPTSGRRTRGIGKAWCRERG